MKKFLRVKDGQFFLNDKRIILRGFALDSWMNTANFMIRIPGNEKRIRETFEEVYGQKNAGKFFNDFLTYFITGDNFIFLKSLGINTIRIPLNHRHFENEQKPGKYKEDEFKHGERVLQLCKKYGS